MKNKIIFSLLIIFSAACEGGSLVNTSSDAEITIDPDSTNLVTVASVHHRSPDENGDVSDEGFHVGDKLIFTKGEGDQEVAIELSEALISWKRFSLISDGDDPSCVEGTQSNININKVEDFLSTDLETMTLGQQSVPRISYCQYQVLIAPLGDDEIEESDLDPSLSYSFQGIWTRGNQTGKFLIQSSDEVELNINFKTKEDGETIDHPLHFESEDESPTVLLGNKYDDLFNGVEGLDFSAENLHHQLSHLVHHGFHHATHQHLGAHHGMDHSMSDGHGH